MVSTVNISMYIFQSDMVSTVNVSMGIFQSDSWFPLLMSVWVYFRVTHGFHC